MNEQDLQKKANTEIERYDNTDDLDKKVFDYLNNKLIHLFSMDIKKKKAIALTVALMTLAFFLGEHNVYILNHILTMSSEYSHSFNTYLSNYIIFFILISPAIYLLSIYWKTKSYQFRVCLAYITGLLTYRLSNRGWDLYDIDNFVNCLGISAVFIILAIVLAYFIENKKPTWISK